MSFAFGIHHRPECQCQLFFLSRCWLREVGGGGWWRLDSLVTPLVVSLFLGEQLDVGFHAGCHAGCFRGAKSYTNLLPSPHLAQVVFLEVFSKSPSTQRRSRCSAYFCPLSALHEFQHRFCSPPTSLPSLPLSHLRLVHKCLLLLDLLVLNSS